MSEQNQDLQTKESLSLIPSSEAQQWRQINEAEQRPRKELQELQVFNEINRKELGVSAL